MSIWKIIAGFLWEYIVGKGVKTDTSTVRHNKIRVIIFLMVLGSLDYNYMVTKRLVIYYEAYTTIDERYRKLKEENKQLQDDNRRMEQLIVEHLEKKRPPKPPLLGKREPP